MRRALVVAVALLALAGCRDDFFDPTPGETVTQQRRVELIAENVTILPGEAGAVRIGFEPEDPTVNLRIERSSSDGRIIACPLRAIDDPLPDPATCLPDLPDGVREGLTSTGLGAVALLREGDPMTLGIRLEFEESGRAFVFRIPSIARPAGASVCKDNGCNPFFEVLPVRGGTLEASASWNGGPARLEALEGRVIARSFTSTGIPYRVAGQTSGDGPLDLRATLTSPGEYALAFVNLSDAGLGGIEIRMRWP